MSGLNLRFLSLLLCLAHLSLAQKTSFNTELLSHVPFSEESSDCWGFEKDGIHYAIIGNNSKTSVFSLEDPRNPILRHTTPGAKSIWRDIKSYNNHLYVTADQGQDGIAIIDMNGAPSNISHTFFRPTLTVGIDTRELQRCHNLYIDEKGYMYLAGCNLSQRGVMIFDLKKDPKSPVFIGAADLTYSHDAFARGDTLYASEINAGRLGIYDISDRSKPKLLASQITSRAFTHNAWPSADSKFVFTTDEKAGGYVDAYDISNLNNIRLLDKFRPLERENDGVIPHNTHYHNGYLVTSWYTDGIRVTDAHKPDNLVEVAYYDTWEDPSICHKGFYGCWGTFPYTGSTIVYGSDINNGLFIVNVNYQRACYLEGKVTDENGTAITSALVEIVSDQINRKYTSAGGVYKTGQANSGNFVARISHPDYQMVEKNVVLNHGEVTELNVQMVRKKTVQLNVIAKNADGKPLPAKVSLLSRTNTYNLDIDNSGLLAKDVLSNTYDIFVSSWGYKVAPFENYNLTGTTPIEVTLEKGYEDDFQNMLGWEIVSSTPSLPGTWFQGIPNQTEYLNGLIANPGIDGDDAGPCAMVTGNGIRGAGCDDVDNGRTSLISPEMDLSSYKNPQLNYDVWFFNAGNGLPINDTLVVKLTNGQKEVVIDKFFGASQKWIQVRNLDVTTFLPPSSNMKLIVEASDQQGAFGHIVEAGFDHFFVTEKDLSSVQDDVEHLHSIAIFPNPVRDILEVRMQPGAWKEGQQYVIHDQHGRQVSIGIIPFHSFQLNTTDLPEGIYSLELPGHKTKRFVVLR